MQYAMTSADCVREITMFCLRRKGRCFRGWAPQIVFRYLAFHFLAGTMEIVRDGRALLGVGIRYTGDMDYFVKHEGKSFDWTLPEPGNCLFIAEVIACKRGIRMLCRTAMKNYANISGIVTFRRGKLVPISLAEINRLAGKEAA